MSRSPLRILVPLLFVLLLPAEGVAWGVIDHRGTGALAERRPSPQARAAVQSMLGRETLAEVDAPPEGHAYRGLQRFVADPCGPNETREGRALALRFAVHLIGDLHPPLHLGNGRDRGGNNVLVRGQQ